jgi:hypothetical protein
MQHSRDVDRAVVAAEVSEFAFPADGRGHAGGTHAPVLAGAHRRDGLERSAQHLLLEPSQLRRGVEAELLAEPVAVDGEGAHPGCTPMTLIGSTLR